MVQIDQLLTPNQQLFVFIALCIVVILVIGLAFVLVRRQLVEMEKRVGGEVTPLWKHLLAELSAIMRHPHPWAAEMDSLLDEANQEPEIHMEPARYERLLVLLAERVLSHNPDLRENEARAAALYLLALPFARAEERSITELTGITLVGSVAPENLSKDDKKAREDES